MGTPRAESEHDHRFLQVDLLRGPDIHSGPARPMKPVLWKLGKEECARHEEETAQVARTALGQLAADATPAQRLRAVEGAWMEVAKGIIGVDSNAQQQHGTTTPGCGHRSAEGRIRANLGRWQELFGVIARRDHTHPSFQPPN